MPLTAGERLGPYEIAGVQIEPLPLPNRIYEQAMVSPDGASAVVQIIDGSIGLWLLDFSRVTLTPLVTTGGSSQAPVWTKDSKHVIYRATRNGVRNLYRKSADGTGDEERLTTKPGMLHTPSSVSADGEWLLFSEVGPQSDRQQWRLELGGGREATAVSGKEIETNGQASPDGRWVAFEASTADGWQVYVRPYPGPGARIPVSRSGGAEPLWSRDGRTLFFRSGAGFYAVDVPATGAFAATAPRLLFEKRFLLSPNGVTAYSQGKDGRLLCVQSVNPEQPLDTINLVLNWGAELQSLVR